MRLDLAALRAFCSIIQMISLTTSFLISVTCFLPRKHRGKTGLSYLCLRSAVCPAQLLSSEVWNSFLILSYLSALLTSVDAHIEEIRSMVPKKNAIGDISTHATAEGGLGTIAHNGGPHAAGEQQGQTKQTKKETCSGQKPKDSDVMLYTPNLDIIAKEKGCECFFMKCFLMELQVYQAENELDFNTTKDYLKHMKQDITTCSPCEAQPAANISTFFTSLSKTLDRYTLENTECFD